MAWRKLSKQQWEAIRVHLPQAQASRRGGRPRAVERTFAWLGHFRRLVVRYERLITTYAGFFHIACALLTLRRVLK
jgi:transposase